MRVVHFAVVLALGVAGCMGGTAPPPSTSSPLLAVGAPAPSPKQALTATIATAAAVADAIGAAPPASVVKVPIGDADILRAWFRFDQALEIIDALVATKVVTPGTPTALTIARSVRTVQGALNAASAAQRAGTATSYRAALVQAQAALANLQVALKGEVR